jgi:L-ascorbate metabolism protein UlaG (beta-lactamase superfamily)
MQITYISHSGFMVETEHAYLLFDYYKGEFPKMDSEKPLYVFSSHFHHDHYNKEIFQLEDGTRKVTYIFSMDIKKRKKRTIQSEHVVFLKEDEKKEVDGLKIETLLSTDEGVAFLVTVDGKTIYHAGDLHWWHWIGDPEEENKERERKYKHEISKLAGRHIDVAFLVLDPRQEEAFDWGFDYFLKEIKPDVAFPMHFWGDHSVIASYCASPKAVDVKDKVQKIEKEGQVFDIEG